MRGDTPEFAAIVRAARLFGAAPEGWVGIGDDAAWIPELRLLITCDTLVEGVHFETGTPLEAVGWKLMAVNVSDIAAMGGEPVAAVVSLAAPGPGAMDPFAAGLARASRELGVPVVGGDTTASGFSGVTVTATLVGTTDRPILRRGARPGDGIWVTGSLGGASLGRHLSFVPRLVESRAIRRLNPTSMIDLSDGLASDLFHILAASSVGAKIDAAAVPISDDARRLAAMTGKDPLHHALGDGEDFELLFTLGPTPAPPVIGCALSRIGTITEGSRAVIRTPSGEVPFPAGGYGHWA